MTRDKSSHQAVVADETRSYEPPIVVATFSIDDLRREAATAVTPLLG
jgi:hypothetical protein